MSLDSLSLGPIISAYRLALQPIPPFTWIGSPISAFDVVAAFRLCFALRQMRDGALIRYNAEQRMKSSTSDDNDVDDNVNVLEEYSLVKNIAVVLVTVYGGEAVFCPWLSIPPSFLSSPLVPGLYAALTVVADALPASLVPPPSFKSEFPLSFLDGLTRAFLLCQLIPPAITTHAVASVAANPWTLVLASLVIANAGFFFVNLCNMTSPTGFSLATPAELRAQGWTTTDLWCAPVTTALYALLTHAQPFWEELHALLYAFASPSAANGGETNEKSPQTPYVLQPLDPESARAACALFLTTLFLTRTVRNFGGAYLKELRGEKKRVMRSRVDGRRYPSVALKKNQ